METMMYRGKSQLRYFGAKNERKSWFEKKPWLTNVIAMTGTIIIALMLVWAIMSYLQIPYAYHSVSANKIVAVYTADGKILPLSPLPERYEIINVK